MLKHKAILFLFVAAICAQLNAQVSEKLLPTTVIGSQSETVNTVANNAFDGNFNTFFASYERSYTWVGLDLGEKYVITKIAYCPREDYNNIYC